MRKPKVQAEWDQTQHLFTCIGKAREDLICGQTRTGGVRSDGIRLYQPGEVRRLGWTEAGDIGFGRRRVMRVRGESGLSVGGEEGRFELKP